MTKGIPVGVSSRHVHLTQEHVEILFGKGHNLSTYKELRQPGEFAAEETVTLMGPKGQISRVRVLGPARSKSQVELALTDGFALGILPPVRNSGDHEKTPGIILKGPAGTVALERGVICAARHIHLGPMDADVLGVSDGDLVDVVAEGTRPVIFQDVLIRVSEKFVPEMHLDTDEANAGGIRNGSEATIVKVSVEPLNTVQPFLRAVK